MINDKFAARPMYLSNKSAKLEARIPSRAWDALLMRPGATRASE